MKQLDNLFLYPSFFVWLSYSPINGKGSIPFSTYIKVPIDTNIKISHGSEVPRWTWSTMKISPVFTNVVQKLVISSFLLFSRCYNTANSNIVGKVLESQAKLLLHWQHKPVPTPNPRFQLMVVGKFLADELTILQQGWQIKPTTWM